MRGVIRNILILLILVLTFLILKFYKTSKNVFDDIIILGLWDKSQNEYEIDLQNPVQIDVFSTIYNKKYKKIAPGSKGGFVIKFKRLSEFNYSIKINEKTSKPQNLVFILENKIYKSLKDMEEVINEKFMNTETLNINWEWKYFVDEKHDIQDTEDGMVAQNYIFELEVICEERTQI